MNSHHAFRHSAFSGMSVSDDMTYRCLAEFQQLRDDLKDSLQYCSLLKELRVFFTAPPEWIRHYVQFQLSRNVGDLLCRGLPEVPRPNTLSSPTELRALDILIQPSVLWFASLRKASSLDKRVVIVRLSKKIMIESIPLRDAVQSMLATARVVIGHRVPTLRDLAIEAKELVVWHDAINQFNLYRLSHHIYANGDKSVQEFTQASYELSDTINLEPLSVLRKKLYVARGQIRTYNSCKGVLINIAGSILQSIHLPKNTDDRFLLPLSKMAPVFGKNLIHLKVRVCTPTYTVVVADLSAFTATCQLVWMTVIVIYLRLLQCHPEELRKPRYGRVGSEYLTFTLEEVLLIYISRTGLCKVKYETYLIKILGGILGLKGNMTLTMMCLHVHCDMMKQKWGLRAVKMKFQIGGDDFFMVVTGSIALMQQATTDVHDFITSHIGRLGTWYVQRIDASHSFELRERYCLKAVLCHARDETTGEVLITTLDKLPLMMDYFVTKPSRLTFSDTTIFLSGVYDCVQKFSLENRAVAYSVLRDVACVIHEMNPMQFEFMKTSPLLVEMDRFDLEGALLVTPTASKMINNVPLIVYENVSFRHSFGSKLQVLLERETPCVCLLDVYTTVMPNRKSVLVCDMKSKRTYTDIVKRVWEPVCTTQATRHIAEQMIYTVREVIDMLKSLEQEVQRIVLVPEWTLCKQQ